MTYEISAEELEWAFSKLVELNLRDISYSSNDELEKVMGAHTDFNPELSAGTETGIKLGLLIAQRREKLRDGQ